MQESGTFEFRQCITIARAVGMKAKNLKELRDAIAVVHPASIYHHTYQYFLKGHTMEYTNDFAQWAGESLENRALSEHLSIVDPYEFKNLEDLRKELLNVIDGYTGTKSQGSGSQGKLVPRDAVPGDEFFFNRGFTVVFPAGIRARNLAEFQIAMRALEKGSIYYHFYDARARQGVDDFSTWVLKTLGKEKLAGQIRAVDPFMISTEGVRAHILRAVEDELINEIEEGDAL